MVGGESGTGLLDDVQVYVGDCYWDCEHKHEHYLLLTSLFVGHFNWVLYIFIFRCWILIDFHGPRHRQSFTYHQAVCHWRFQHARAIVWYLCPISNKFLLTLLHCASHGITCLPMYVKVIKLNFSQKLKKEIRGPLCTLGVHIHIIREQILSATNECST